MRMIMMSLMMMVMVLAAIVTIVIFIIIMNSLAELALAESSEIATQSVWEKFQFGVTKVCSPNIHF